MELMALSSTKVCSKCGKELSLGSFYKNGDGYRPECKKCKQKAEAARRSKNVEVARAKERERYHKNRDKNIASMKRYRNTLKETNYFKFFVMNKKKAALMAGLSWDLDEEYLRKIFTGICPVFGCSIHAGGTKDDYKAELDRLVPSKGYIKGNVRWISSRANRLKSDMSIDELKKILKYMEEQIEHS